MIGKYNLLVILIVLTACNSMSNQNPDKELKRFTNKVTSSFQGTVIDETDKFIVLKISGLYDMNMFKQQLASLIKDDDRFEVLGTWHQDDRKKKLELYLEFLDKDIYIHFEQRFSQLVIGWRN